MVECSVVRCRNASDGKDSTLMEWKGRKRSFCREQDLGERVRDFVRSFSNALAEISDRGIATDITRGTEQRHKNPLKQPLL